MPLAQPRNIHTRYGNFTLEQAKKKLDGLIQTKWVSRRHGTRHVVDQTGGLSVVFIQGRRPKSVWLSYYHKLCTLEEWLAYEKTAKQVSW